MCFSDDSIFHILSKGGLEDFLALQEHCKWCGHCLASARSFAIELIGYEQAGDDLSKLKASINRVAGRG